MFIETVRDYVDYLNSFPSFINGDINILELLKATLLYVSHAFKDLVVYIFTFQWLRDFIEIPLLLRHTYTCIDNFELAKNTQKFAKLAEGTSVSHLGFFSLLELDKFYSSHFGTGFFNSFFLCCPMTVSHFLTIRALLVNGVPAAISSGLGLLLGQLSFLICVLLGVEFIITPWLNLHHISIIAGILVLLNAVKDLNENPGWEEPIEIYKRPDLLQKLFRTTLSLSWFEQVCIFNCLGNITTVGTSTVLETAGANFWMGTTGYVLGLVVGCCVWGVGWAVFVSRIRWFVIGSSLREVSFIHNACMSMVLAFSLASFPYYGSEYFTGKVLGFLPGDPTMSWYQDQTSRVYFPIDYIATAKQSNILSPSPVPDYQSVIEDRLEMDKKEARGEKDKHSKEDETGADGFVFRYHSKCSPEAPHGAIESNMCTSEMRYGNIEHDRTRMEEEPSNMLGEINVDFIYKDGLKLPPYSSKQLIKYKDFQAEIEAVQREIDILKYRQLKIKIKNGLEKPSRLPILNPELEEQLKTCRDKQNMERYKRVYPNKPLPALEERQKEFEDQLYYLKEAMGRQGSKKPISYAHHLYRYLDRPDKSLEQIQRDYKDYYDIDLEIGLQAECQFAFRDKYFSNPLYPFLLRLDMYPFSLGQSREEALDADEEALLFAHRLAIQNYANSISFFGDSQRTGGFARQVSNQQFKGTLGVLRSFRIAQIQEPQPLGKLPPPNIKKPVSKKPEKKSFFRSLFSRKNKKAAIDQQTVKAEQNLEDSEQTKPKKKSFFRSLFSRKNKQTEIEQQEVKQVQAEQNLEGSEQTKPDDQKTDQQAGKPVKAEQKQNDKKPMWTGSKAGLKHKVLKYDQPLPQRIEDQENFAFHEELELLDSPKNPLKEIPPMVDQSVPMYIGWDGNLRKFLVKTHIAPHQVYTSTQIYTDPHAIYKDTDLESKDTDLEAIKTAKPKKEIPTYYSFQSWAKAVERVRPGQKDSEYIVRLPTANYSKQELADLKKLLLGHILTEAHQENERKLFKTNLEQLHKDARKKVNVLLNHLPDYDWWWRVNLIGEEFDDKDEDIVLNKDNMKKSDRDGSRERRGNKKFSLASEDINYIAYMTNMKDSDKINIDRNEKIDYNDQQQLAQIDKNLREIYSGYFNLGSTSPPGVYGLAWPGVRNPGANRIPGFMDKKRSATQHLLTETLEDLKEKNKANLPAKDPTLVMSIDANRYSNTPTKKGMDLPK